MKPRGGTEQHWRTRLGGLALCAVAACSEDARPPPAAAHSAPLSSLAGFPIGVAVPADPFPNSLLQSSERQVLVDRHFDSLTAENIMKMRYLQPSRGEFRFERADALVDYGRQRGMIIHGHALVWHRQAPAWMNDLEGSPDDFRRVLETHVRTVARHFRGKVASWDVVNEAFEDEAPIGYRRTIWYESLGPEYIEMAFRWARAEDPEAYLYYNDYDISGALGPHKLERILAMVDDFKERGVPLDGLGFQMHVDLETPAIGDIEAAFGKAVARGILVRVSELDISVNTRREHTQMNDELEALQRQRYEDVVRAYVETVPPAQRGGITVWGITDGDSWIPGFRKRPDWPLLFDAEFREKPALAGMAAGLVSVDEP